MFCRRRSIFSISSCSAENGLEFTISLRGHESVPQSRSLDASPSTVQPLRNNSSSQKIVSSSFKSHEESILDLVRAYLISAGDLAVSSRELGRFLHLRKLPQDSTRTALETIKDKYSSLVIFIKKFPCSFRIEKSSESSDFIISLVAR